MNDPTTTILDQILKLPPRERAVIAERLISSLDNEVDWDVEIAWQQEVQRRIDEIESGSVLCVPWEQVREQLTTASKR